jgi:hypothetical protein
MSSPICCENGYLVMISSIWCGNYVPYKYTKSIEEGIAAACKAVRETENYRTARIFNLTSLRDEYVYIYRSYRQLSEKREAIHIVWEETYQSEDGILKRKGAFTGESEKITLTIDLPTTNLPTTNLPGNPNESFRERIKRRACL